MPSKTNILLISTAAIVIAIPALGQDKPESLLPPGFEKPAPPVTPKTVPNSPPTGPSQIKPAPPLSPNGLSPRPDKPLENAASQAGQGAGSSEAQQAVSSKEASASQSDGDSADDLDLEEIRMVFDIPAANRRSTSQVGIISQDKGGLPAEAFGNIDGKALISALRQTKGPLTSRWGSIITRRMLASRTNTPSGINGADWVAERAWLLLRMGESYAARQLVQQVDAGNYTKRLYEVSMQSFLANADLGGMCPLASTASNKIDDPSWKMARPICSSLSGEQGAASGLLNQARKNKWMVGADFLLAEKAIGAGTNGRRSVKVEWDNVTGFNAWRFGLAYATGIQPPAKLLKGTGRHLDGWKVQLPMIDINARIAAAPVAATLGVLSNNAMVDIYARALDDTNTNDTNKGLAENLSLAYAGENDAARVKAMAGFWSDDKAGLQSMLVLTARAAALVAPSSEFKSEADMLIASMMTAGLDSQAVRWTEIVDGGSLGWGILAVGAPGLEGKISYSQLDDFYDNDQSVDVHKSSLLIAGLAGLGRVDASDQKDFVEKIDIDITKQSIWSRAITSAAERSEPGTVVLLAATALQKGDWTQFSPHYLFYIVRSLRLAGLDAEARMIAAEAVTFG
jgi:hypothetical protein